MFRKIEEEMSKATTSNPLKNGTGNFAKALKVENKKKETAYKERVRGRKYTKVSEYSLGVLEGICDTQ